MTPERIPSRDENEQGGSLEILQTLIRRRWFFLAPLFTVGLLGYVLSNVLPLQYRSSAFIIVEQKTVPDKLVAPNVLMSLQKRLDSMTQQILSRTRLQRFIEDFGLYQGERKRMAIDEVIDMMRNRISVELVQTKDSRQADLTGFHVYFSDGNPNLAQRITNELTSLFIEQDARERTQQSQQTTAFFESQFDEARKQLADQEQKVSDYKLQHLGELPSQQESNLRILSSLEVQLQANTSALDRAEQQRIYLESMRSQQDVLAGLTSANQAQPGTSADPAAAPGLASSTNSLAMAQDTVADLMRQLRDLTAKFTDQHPDVIRLRKEIADWQNTIQRLRVEPAAGAELASRLKATLAEIENNRREGEDLRKRIRKVQTQLSQTPVREQEMAELMRQYDNAKTNFQSLLQKKLDSQLATNLEERQGGEQFRLLDPADLPKKAEGREEIVLAGRGLAAALGAGLTILREMLDRSIHRHADLQLYEGIPVLARIPTVQMDRDVRKQAFRRRMEVAALVCMVLISLASAAQTIVQR